MTKIITLNIICFVFMMTLNGQTADAKYDKKLELFFSCQDVNKPGNVIIDSVKSCDLEFTNKQFFATYKNDSCFLCTKYVIKTYNNKKFIYPSDSIWGIRSFSENGKNTWLYKGIPEGNCLLVIQSDKMIIYRTYDGSGLNGGRIYIYFGENLCSEVYPLKRKYLKEVYRNQPRFLELIKKDFKWYQSVADNEYTTKKYRIVETYKRSLGN